MRGRTPARPVFVKSAAGSMRISRMCAHERRLLSMAAGAGRSPRDCWYVLAQQPSVRALNRVHPQVSCVEQAQIRCIEYNLGVLLDSGWKVLENSSTDIRKMVIRLGSHASDLSATLHIPRASHFDSAGFNPS